MLSNKLYDVLKWIALVFIPAFGSLYLGIAEIWGFPYGQEIVNTCIVIDTFLGVLIGISTYQYNKKLGD